MKKWLLYASCLLLGLTLLAPMPARAKKHKDKNNSSQTYNSKKAAKEKKKAEKKARKEQHKAAKKANKAPKQW